VPTLVSTSCPVHPAVTRGLARRAASIPTPPRANAFCPLRDSYFSRPPPSVSITTPPASRSTLRTRPSLQPTWLDIWGTGLPPAYRPGTRRVRHRSYFPGFLLVAITSLTQSTRLSAFLLMPLLKSLVLAEILSNLVV
jgi:hypothetical protein